MSDGKSDQRNNNTLVRQSEVSLTDDLSPQTDTVNIVNNSNESSAETELSHKVGLEPGAPRLILKAKPMSEYKGQRNMNTDPNKGLYILANFQNDTAALPIKLLLDSGSSMSLLHNAVYDLDQCQFSMCIHCYYLMFLFICNVYYA